MGERLELGGGLRRPWDEIQGWGREAPRRWTWTASPATQAPTARCPSCAGEAHSHQGALAGWLAGWLPDSCPHPSRFCGTLLLGWKSCSQDAVLNRLQKSQFEMLTVALTLAFRTTLGLWKFPGLTLNSSRARAERTLLVKDLMSFWDQGLCSAYSEGVFTSLSFCLGKWHILGKWGGAERGSWGPPGLQRGLGPFFRSPHTVAESPLR